MRITVMRMRKGCSRSRWVMGMAKIIAHDGEMIMMLNTMMMIKEQV